MLNRLFQTIREAFIPANIAPVSLRQLWLESDLTPDEIANYCEVIDRQSPTTILCFSGLALGFVGLPSYEFRKSMGAMGETCNLIFVRDVRRFWYHLSPDGDVTGLEFYTTQLQKRLQALGTQYLITTGVSAGGYAALYFGWRLGADQVIAFSPQADLVSYCRLTPFSLLRSDRSPANLRSYLKEELMVALTLRRRTRLLKQKLPLSEWGRLDPTLRTNASSQAQVYYCEQNRLDAQEALKLRDLPGVTLQACHCDQHNAAGYLRDRGQLFAILQSLVTSAAKD